MIVSTCHKVPKAFEKLSCGINKPFVLELESLAVEFNHLFVKRLFDSHILSNVRLIEARGVS